MGAQVVAGIGFIGAGTIIVTKRQRVKGLTTAAGLWTSAIVGLAVGMGFCEVGILVTAMVLLAEVIFSKVEYRLKANTPELNLFVGCENTACLEHMNKLLTQQGVIILNTQVVRADESTGNIVHAILLLRLPRGLDDKSLLLTIGQIPGVTEISEL